MELIATSGYLVCTLAFLVLTLLLRSSWQGKLQGALIIATAIATIFWGAVSARSIYFSNFDWLWYAGELSRDIMWIVLLHALIWLRARHTGATSLLWMIGTTVSAISTVIIFTTVYKFTAYFPDTNVIFRIHTIGFVLLNLIGLVLVEQLIRNTPPDQRWSIKFFCIGVGGLFVYDFYLYSEALLFQTINGNLLAARGFINTMVVPLIAIAAARNPDWTVPVHVSRKFVFHSTSLIGAGFYLVAMAMGGYYIKVYGGSWGSIAQIIFLFGAMVLLGVLLSSGNLRSKLKVFLARNFFSYKYDYREEWQHLMASMSEERASHQVTLSAIKAIADIVESPAGMLWLKNQNGNFSMAVNWNMDDTRETEPEESSFVGFLKSKHWIINLKDYNRRRDIYSDLKLPNWLNQSTQAWLVVPLLHQSELRGFAVLAKPRAAQKINWEDRELLLVVGRQIASYIALLQANEELFQARQFEAFNRLSAYVVHDLKNIVAQLSLVVNNATKHKHNPAFVDDALCTVDNATQKMIKLLNQLRKGRLNIAPRQEPINVIRLIEEAIERRSIDMPIPKLFCHEDEVMARGDYDRLLSVLEHLIQNAQDATSTEGHIHIRCSQDYEKQAKIEIEDNGCGMDEAFLRERLFKPFQTTKGNAGMGIGVYESREYVVAMGGALSVKSELDKGTIFTIHLSLSGNAIKNKPLDRSVGISG